MNYFFILILLNFACLKATAAETDDFSARYNKNNDALPLVNQHVQKQVNDSLLSLNQLNLKNEKIKCDVADLNTELGKRLRRFIYGQVEGFINSDPRIPRNKPTFESSVYRNIPSWFYTILFIGSKLNFGFGSNIQHDRFLIGADKFGHFFDEGYYFYELVTRFGYPLNDVLKFSLISEETISGGWSSGVLSYADLAANYDGFRFWLDALGNETIGVSSKYFSCEKGQWRQKEAIDLAQYLNAAWDEGMNCSHFRTPDLENGVQMTIKELESTHQKRFKCPVFPEYVPAMKSRYKEYSSYILNPVLL